MSRGYCLNTMRTSRGKAVATESRRCDTAWHPGHWKSENATIVTRAVRGPRMGDPITGTVTLTESSSDHGPFAPLATMGARLPVVVQLASASDALAYVMDAATHGAAPNA